jgi:hypothetical protein
MLQFALLVPCVSHLIAVAPTLDAGALALYAALVVGSTLTLGALLEGRRAAIRIEQARAVALGLAFVLLPAWFGFDAPLMLRAAALVMLLGAAAWLEKNIKTTPWRTT